MDSIINHCTKHLPPNEREGIRPLDKQTMSWLMHDALTYNQRQRHTQENPGGWTREPSKLINRDRKKWARERRVQQSELMVWANNYPMRKQN